MEERKVRQEKEKK
jgi:hypothetical protein